MSELNEKLLEIKRQKDTYIIPGNLKKNVTAFGVTGTYEGSGGSGDVKLFDTIEHMQEDETAQEGDLAVVYREEIQPVTEDSEFDSCIFPNEVVLSEAFTDSIYGRFSSTDGGYFDGMVDMSSSNFRFDGWGESSQVRVEYTSQDGITYIRTDGGEELQEFGTTIKWDDGMGSFNSVIGNFMKIGGNYFDGMYEYGNYLDSNYRNSFININSIIKDEDYFVASTGKFISDLYNIRNVRPYVVLQKSSGTFHDIDFCEMTEAYELSDSENWIGPSRSYPSGVVVAKDLSENKFTIFYVKASMSDQVPDIQSIEIGHYINNNLVEETKNVTYYGKSTYVSGYKFYFYKIADITEVVYIDDIYFSYSGDGSLDFNVWQYYSTTDMINGPQFLGALKYDFGINYNKYNLISSQLNATSDYVYEKTFYGKNGVGNGTITTNISNSFVDVNAEMYAKLQISYNNITPRILTDNDKDIDNNTYIIPVNSMGEPLLDTSAMTNMSSLFRSKNKIKCIPKLDTSNVTNMDEAFDYCDNLEYIALMDTSNVTNMSEMLREDKNLKEIPLFNTSNVTTMASMCWGCDTITTFPLLDTSNVTIMSCMFNDCDNLVNVPLLDTSNVTTMFEMFARCNSLTTIPLFNTVSVTNMAEMFKMCYSLTNVPQLNTSNVTNMNYMFGNCPKLNNESLNTILAMCINATKITTNKTLKYIGLSSEQATICQSLSNYSAFTSAGWTTGY